MPIRRPISDNKINEIIQLSCVADELKDPNKYLRDLKKMVSSNDKNHRNGRLLKMKTMEPEFKCFDLKEASVERN